MPNAKLNVIYNNEDILVIDKPPGVIVFPEGSPLSGKKQVKEKTLIDYLLEEFPNLKKTGKDPRYGIVHRLDKDTSGIILVAKNNKSLEFLQKQFKERKVIKKYVALVVGNPKKDKGVIETLIGRAPKDRRKQKVYLFNDPDAQGKRKAVTEYKVLKNFRNYALMEVVLKTGRKHQIRCHLGYLGHPIAEDKLYGFKNQLCPNGLNRHFLHASYLKIELPGGGMREIKSELPDNLKKILKDLKT
ncbi:RluA family pseudouridine synthase [Patescibacteria group bacterium]